MHALKENKDNDYLYIYSLYTDFRVAFNWIKAGNIFFLEFRL